MLLGRHGNGVTLVHRRDTLNVVTRILRAFLAIRATFGVIDTRDVLVRPVLVLRSVLLELLVSPVLTVDIVDEFFERKGVYTSHPIIVFFMTALQFSRLCLG